MLKLKPPGLTVQVLLALAMLLIPGSAAGNPADRAAAGLRDGLVPGEILVRIKPGAAGAPEAFLASRGGKVGARYAGGLDGLILVRLDRKEDADSLLHALNKRPDIVYAEPNYVVYPALTPGDPEFWRSWGLHNTGQKYRSFPGRRGTDDIDIDAPEAWDTTTGSNATVLAVIDTGINYNHTDLSDNIWTNPGEIAGNGTDDDANGFADDIRGWNFNENNNDPSDPDGHGTAVASIAGACTNTQGTCGACPTVSLMPLRVGLGENGSISQTVWAIQYAVNNGAHVINASWGTSSFSQSLYDAINLARAANVVFVAAAGNSSSNIDTSPYYPASFSLDNIISVAAVDSKGLLASFSSYGSMSVDVAAPGVDIYAAEGDSYTYFSGTSAAAPFVSGVAALLISASPAAPCTETCSRIITCANRLPDLSGKCVSSGMVNAYNALSLGQPAVVLDSVSQNILGTGDSSTITWTSRRDGTYSVEVGGNGTAGSGNIVEAGTCQIDDQILSTVTEADLPDNQPSLVYIIIAEAPSAGFAVVTLYDDQTGPSVQVGFPTPDSTLGTLNQITGTAADTGGAQTALVSLALYDGSFYYDGALFVAVDPVYLNATGTAAWTFDSSPVPWADGTTYSIYVQAGDTVGNIANGESPVSFTYLAGAPTVLIESVSPRVLGGGDSSTITWQSDLVGDYSVEVGGTGSPGTGTEVETGTCTADSPVYSVVTEADLADDSASSVRIFVTAGGITGSAGATLYDDQTAPRSNIIQPLNGQTYTELNAVLGRASDTGFAEVAGVEVQITDGTGYWDGDLFAADPTWVAAEGTTEWSLNTSSVPWADFTHYTVRSRATDSAGNVESYSDGVTFYFDSGNTVIVKKKSSGCNLANPKGSGLSTLLFLAVISIFYTIHWRRHRNSRIQT